MIKKPLPLMFKLSVCLLPNSTLMYGIIAKGQALENVFGSMHL